MSNYATQNPQGKKYTKSSTLNEDYAVAFSSGARIPPHSVIAEESVLGAVLLDNYALNGIVEVVNATDFYRPANRSVFEAFVKLSDRREPIDPVTLTQALRSMGVLDEVGGLDYIARLATVVPSSANSTHYAKIVKDLALRRKVIHEASQIIESAFEQDAQIEDFMDGVESRILALSDSRSTGHTASIGDIVQDSIRIIEQLFDRKQPITGVASGFVDLDRLTAGFQPSDLIIVAARPSMGKTSLAMGIAAQAALTNDGSVAVFSLEMSKEQLALRLLCSEAAVDNSRVRTGDLKGADFSNLINAAGRLAESSLFIDDTPALTPIELRAKCRRLHRDKPLSLIVVDYLQLMRNPQYSNAREQEISNISRSLKALAKELSVPVVALSQLNRSVESRNDKRPLMSDLRESGAIEQDADIIMFIYRDEVYNENSEHKGIAEIIISKQRNGPTGVVKLAFSPQFTRFDNLAYEDDVQGFEGNAEEDGFSVLEMPMEDDPLF